MAATPQHAEELRWTTTDYVQRAVLAIARADGSNVVKEPLPSESTLVPTVPQPLAGVRAALAVERAAHAQARRFIRAAREDGHTWDEVGAALGLASRPLDITTSLGEAAHNWAVTGAADGNGPHRPTGHHRNAWAFTWRCPDCNGRVSDHGPVEGNPVDAEPGHTTDCTRLATAVDAYHAEWDEEADA